MHQILCMYICRLENFISVRMRTEESQSQSLYPNNQSMDNVPLSTNSSQQPYSTQLYESGSNKKTKSHIPAISYDLGEYYMNMIYRHTYFNMVYKQVLQLPWRFIPIIQIDIFALKVVTFYIVLILATSLLYIYIYI